MSPEHFRRIEALYHAAREANPEEREALLAGTEPEMRREIELLLSAGRGCDFLDRPAIQNAPELLAGSTAALEAGGLLGPYPIERKLGEGGMGGVLRAIDTRVGRGVAIKTARQQFSAGFEREARAIASLNHPHICQLYDIGPNYLVMELVEGETLAERIGGGAFSMNEALALARQIGNALDAAHERGIIHRDLKPANIKITPEGAIKVLDFGLATNAGHSGPATESHPESMEPTAVREIMGTAAYMAPEQARGKPADKRADIWAFGVVLYEMLTGSRLFEGATISETLAAVLIKEPEWERVPARARPLLKSCLE